MNYVTDPDRPHLGGNIRGGDPRSRFPDLWAWLVERYAVRSVLDVGCAEGDALRAFASLGCVVIGLEGLPQNAALCAPHPVLVHDLQAGPPPSLANIDLVWSCETAEHVEESCADWLLDALCCGRVLALTAAPPVSSGHHHVNERPPAYWRDLLAKRGFRLDEGATAQSKSLAGWWWQISGAIYTRPADYRISCQSLTRSADTRSE